MKTIIPALILILIVSCSKDGINSTQPNFPVNNAWECTVDGINYAGSIDTSFYEIRRDFSGINDTIVHCSGTSSDKKANIHFRVNVNRRATRHDSVSTQTSQAEFHFDTVSSNYLKAFSNLGGVTYKVEGLNTSKFNASFAGTAFAIEGGGNKLITNGKLSFDFNIGSNEPKFYSFKSDNTTVPGYVYNARFISNVLVIDGLGFNTDSTFRMMIRTGSKIKTGTFESRKGDVGFQTFRPSIVTSYVSDTIGNMVVTIHSVQGNIVEGSFTGPAQGSSFGSQVTISGGKFKCRVKDYLPQEDSTNKWGFSESNAFQYPYNTMGGNILSAKRSQNSFFQFLTVRGESDRGQSRFAIKLRSTTTISTGLYQLNSYPNALDSVYFISPAYTYSGENGNNLFCRIDYIDNQRVEGVFFGTIRKQLSPYMWTPVELRKGYFKASF